MGDPETAKMALEYVVAVSMNGQAAAEQGEAWKHVGRWADFRVREHKEIPLQAMGINSWPWLRAWENQSLALSRLWRAQIAVINKWVYYATHPKWYQN